MTTKETFKVWVLTTAYNDYDQHGDYFLKVFCSKPTHDQLLKEIPDSTDDLIIHILNGGGRIGNDYQLWDLTCVDC